MLKFSIVDLILFDITLSGYPLQLLVIIYPQTDIGMMVRVSTNSLGNLDSIPVQVIPKTQKWYLMPPCLTLSIIRYGQILKGKRNKTKLSISVFVSVVAIEKGAFGSPSTTVSNFTYFYLSPTSLIAVLNVLNEPA